MSAKAYKCVSLRLWKLLKQMACTQEMKLVVNVNVIGAECMVHFILHHQCNLF